MTKKMFLAIALLICPASAMAQNKPEVYDDSELGRAMAVCAKYEIEGAIITTEPVITRKREYHRDWKLCYRIRAKWEGVLEDHDVKMAREKSERQLLNKMAK